MAGKLTIATNSSQIPLLGVVTPQQPSIKRAGAPRHPFQPLDPRGRNTPILERIACHQYVSHNETVAKTPSKSVSPSGTPCERKRDITQAASTTTMTVVSRGHLFQNRDAAICHLLLSYVALSAHAESIEAIAACMKEDGCPGSVSRAALS